MKESAQMSRLLLLLGLLSACARNIAPVAVVVTRSEAQLARGEYLARSVMACGSCHSERDWTRLGGPAREGTEFGGSLDIARTEGFPDSFSFWAPNLTPHGLSTWSDGELARAIVFGQRPDQRGLFPYMPYFEYRDSLAADDLAAVVAYLRTLPSIAKDAPGAVRFPMPGFVLNRFPEERALRPTAPTEDTGRYLLEIAGCAGCHTEADKRGTFIGPRYAGGREFRVPAPGAGTVRSANLTPDLETGLGAWTKERFIARFRSGVDPRAEVTAGGFNTVMPWWAWSRMNDADLGAIFDSLRALPPVKRGVTKHSP
jgi:mono/diheme cytochrome c family protein